VLADALETMAEVWVVAPNSEQSAVSHALTLDRPLRIERMAERRFTVDGTPTDCVTLAISSLLEDRRPDLVVSGINFGANMGVDVHYSGTVSAAFEGVILGCPALAVSSVRGEGMSFHVAAQRQRPVGPAKGCSFDTARGAALHRGCEPAARSPGAGDLLDRRRRADLAGDPGDRLPRGWDGLRLGHAAPPRFDRGSILGGASRNAARLDRQRSHGVMTNALIR